jgi:enolase-phosphatase E1
VIAVDIDAFLLDIEGTTSSIDFVYQSMFPYVRRELEVFLYDHFQEPAVEAAIEQIAGEAGWPLLPDALQHEAFRSATLQRVRDEVIRLMDRDAKSTGLKELQGLIWRTGFETGELVAHVFPDVPPALQLWNSRGKEVRIYSSGSIAAQQLFFAHTVAGDLRPLISGHYDTTFGAKRDPDSYRRIASHWSRPADRIMFISDIPAELAAAVEAGFQTLLAIRPGNPPQDGGESWPRVASFSEIVLEQPA